MELSPFAQGFLVGVATMLAIHWLALRTHRIEMSRELPPKIRI